MMNKILLVVILISVLISIILFIINRVQKNKINNLSSEKESLIHSYNEVKDLYFKMIKEHEIEKKHKDEIIKKLSKVANMSIDDVLRELSDNKTKGSGS